MEMEIEDLHIQMEDVVKTKLSVSFGILLPDAPTSIIPQFPPQHALVFKSVVCVCVCVSVFTKTARSESWNMLLFKGEIILMQFQQKQQKNV